MSKYKPADKISFKEVESSNVKSVGYDPETQGLYITFKSNEIYIYQDVPQKTYDDFMEAPSFGKFLNANIKNKFSFEKVAKAA